MIVQMGNHLFFGFRNEAEIPFIARQSAYRSDRKRSPIPERIQDAFAAAEFIEAFARTKPDDRFLLQQPVASVCGLPRFEPCRPDFDTAPGHRSRQHG